MKRKSCQSVSFRFLAGMTLTLAVSTVGYSAGSTDCVVLLHGLSRTDNSMQRLEQALSRDGYRVANIHYDSRHATVEELAHSAVNAGLEECREHETSRIHFATHSLGGILVRYYLKSSSIDNLGRVVMMAPPNRGSEVVDMFGQIPGFDLIGGEAATQLGTGPDGIPAQLGPVSFELGVIAGTRSISPTSIALPDRDDGLVTVENTKIEGMKDFVELPYSHTFIMLRQTTIDQVRSFISDGYFIHPSDQAEPESISGSEKAAEEI